MKKKNAILLILFVAIFANVCFAHRFPQMDYLIVSTGDQVSCLCDGPDAVMLQ